MPGLTVTLGPDAPATLSALRSHALEGVSSVQAGSAETILETPRAAALLTAYDSYPRRRLVTRDVLIFVEGFVDADDAELRRIVEGIVNSDSKRQEEALRELRTRDGEFVLLVHQEHDGRTWILNDSYGHLPLYRVDRGSGTLLSRDEAIHRIAKAADGDLLIDENMDLLPVATHKQWLIRILHNLHMGFDRRGQVADSRAMAEMIWLVEQED